MLIFEIPWSKACDKNPYFTFLRIFSLLWRHVCWAIIIHANFSEAKKVFCKKSPVSFREKTKRRDSYQVSFSATFLKQTLTIYNCTVPQKVKNEQYYWKLIVINVPTIILAYYPPWAKKFFTTSTGGGLFWWKGK